MKKFIALMLILSILMFSGCELLDESNSYGIEQAEQPQNQPEIANPMPGGYMYLSVYNFDTWNPIMTKSMSVSQVSSLVYEGLFKRMPDMRMVPCLAQSYTVSDNALTYTFYLRDGAMWHDGTAFTAADVEYTVREIMKNDSIYRNNVENIASTRVVNNSTYSVTLKQPMVGFTALMSFPIMKNWTNDIASVATYMPMGTGYYRYTDGHMGKTLTLKSIGSHWSGEMANIEMITVKQLPDKEAVKYSFDASEVDVMYQSFFETLTYSPKQHAQTVSYVSNNVLFLGINANREVLAGANTRKAISLALDREYIAKSVLIDKVKPAVLPIKPGSWILPDEYASVARDNSWARDLLEQDGWTMGDNGLMQRKNGDVTTILQFSVIVNEDNAQRIAVLESIKKNLADIGVVLNIERLPFDTYRQRVEAKNYDMFIGEVAIAEEYDLSMFGSKTAEYCVTQSGDIDVVIDRIKRAKSDDEVRAEYEELARAFADEMPVVTLCFSMDTMVCNSKIRGDILPVQGDVYGNIRNWYAN